MKFFYVAIAILLFSFVLSYLVQMVAIYAARVTRGLAIHSSQFLLHFILWGPTTVFAFLFLSWGLGWVAAP